MIKVDRQTRAAFVLNANAKSVTKARLKKLSALIPKKDLFVSHDLKEAHSNLLTILKSNYHYVFCGGGDGTAMLVINQINEYQKKHDGFVPPSVGVLRLGTGNALARLLKASSPEVDIKTILANQAVTEVPVSMVETKSGQLSPFAGIGYDGELMNDFESVKDIFFESPFRKFFSSVLGYSIAGVFKTLPRQVARDLPTIKVSSSYPAYRIMRIKGVDQEIRLDQGQILYQGAAPLISVGTVPWVGYGITLFPFAHRKPGYMHLRVSAVPLSVCLLNLYPSIWQGHFRHKKLFDFLVKDVNIESEKSLPYQIGGDAMGYRKKLYFRVCKSPISMVSIHGDKNH